MKELGEVLQRKWGNLVKFCKVAELGQGLQMGVKELGQGLQREKRN